MKNTVEILSGPSREELFDGLRLFAEKRTVDFVVRKEKSKFIISLTLSTTIQSIQAEDGSGQSWNIIFNVYTEELFKLAYSYFPEGYHERHKREKKLSIQAYYSTKNRKGVITL